MNGFDIPNEILDAANLVSNWMRANGVAQLCGLQQRTDPLEHIDILQSYEGKNGRRQWSDHGVWLHPGQAVAVINQNRLGT